MNKVSHWNFRYYKIIIFICSLIICIFFLEILTRLLYSINPSNKNDVLNEITIENTFNSSKKLIELFGPSVVHPYIGFVNDPTEDSTLNAYGFGGNNPLGKRDPDTLRIGIFGGSFAGYVSYDAGTILKEELKKSPLYSNKTIDIESIVGGGMKQPQQLMALNYFLVMGAEYDIIINIDGFNEAVLPISENIPHNVNPIFPRSWFTYARQTLNKDVLLEIESIKNTRYIMDKLLFLDSKTFLRKSALFKFIANTFIRVTNNILRNKNNKISKLLEKNDGTYQIQGPPFMKEEVINDIKKTWSNSSIQMSFLAKLNNSIYIHILQPNQYILNSKNFSPDEKRIAINPDKKYQKMVQDGYIALREEEENLLSKNIYFYDFTNIFNTHNESLYIDDCCHVNKRGSEIVAKEIAKIILNINFK